MTAVGIAVGIHAHDRFKLGLQRASDPNKPALLLADILSGTIPAHPASADFIGKLVFPMNGNSRIGDCFAVAVANDMIATSAFCGTPYTPSEADVIALYSSISGYDPQTGENDNGCEMQDGLEKLLARGIGNGKGEQVKPVAFAKAKATDTTTIEAGISILGGANWGVELQNAQQAQTDASPPKWDYKQSVLWGYHAVYAGAFEPTTSEDVDIESWTKRIAATSAFRQHQLGEVWFIIWPWHLEHPAFLEGVDLEKLAAAYRELTGKTLPIPTPIPTPIPAPIPLSDVIDHALWTAVKPWTERRHVRENRRAVEAVVAWAEAKGFA